jgi:hypothetical protein
MERVQRLFPTATICVDEREEEEYRKVVDPANLLVHPPMDRLGRVMNWLFETVKEETIVEIDDDVTCAWTTVGKPRKITAAHDLLAIIDNAFVATTDLDLTAFTFAKTRNITVIDPWLRPILPVQGVAVVMGLRGKARQTLYDVEAFGGRADVDYTLEILKRDRAIYCDSRFYFANGRIFGGRGGNVGLIQHGEFEQATERLTQKWGRYVTTSTPNYQKKQGRSVKPVSISVSRQNPTATA